MLSYTEEARSEIIESLREQMVIEGKLIDLYEKYEREVGNKALKRVMQMFKLDSQRHVFILQASIDIVGGEDIFMEDKQFLGESLAKHLELEAEALKRANYVLGKTLVRENKGLKGLLEIWRDDERRHHKVLKDMISKTYFSMGEGDMVSMFRDEDFLEGRYRRSKEFQERKTKS